MSEVITIEEALRMNPILLEQDRKETERQWAEDKLNLIANVNEIIIRNITRLSDADGWIHLSFLRNYYSPELRMEVWPEYEKNGILLNLVLVKRSSHALYGKLESKRGYRIPYIGPEYNEVVYSDYPITIEQK